MDTSRLIQLNASTRLRANNLSKVSDAYLPGLGVEEVAQQRDPTVDTFPAAFNPSNKGVWDTVIRGLTLTTNVAANWNSAINNYVDECVAQGKYPFTNLHQSTNDFITSALLEGRREVVRFLNKSHALDIMTIKTTKRVVKMHSSGFTLYVTGWVRLKEPNLVVKEWLLQAPWPRFTEIKDHVYRKKLSSTTTMVVYNEGLHHTNRWHIGYEINIHRFPLIAGNPTPNRAEYAKFIRDIMWMPILRGHRPFGLHHRLI